MRLSVTALLSLLTVVQPSSPGTTWLDRPLANWNTAEAPLARPAGPTERDAVRTRCKIPSPMTAAQRALEEAGWIAYDHLDRAVSRDDVEIVGGMTDADAECRPRGFQLFVFAGATFAGTLSPDPMTTGQDASAGAVRIVGPDAITAEFARYGNKDMPCCPTSRVTVRYRFDRAGSRPLLVPVDIRTTRGQ
jgi:hypothetical protein